ncbi:fungal mating-type pheromone [Serpula lacrymans var. lacrymans S7.3]|uniref:Fungal mating-type pheromone n=1 Tax=Serpula lacrymans var. lacrymans (strain S7.3) TaxID=936435 RepID=F8QGC8_SERL3|nr:fungal mating-type pheromone [Serpula lacrymans var. lacrymans S7.3]
MDSFTTISLAALSVESSETSTQFSSVACEAKSVWDAESPPVDSDNLSGYYGSFCVIA